MNPMTERLLIVAVSVLAAITLVALLRRHLPYETLMHSHPFTAATYTIVGAVYGVYLAFTIVVVWQQFNQAEENATSEAVHLSEVWRDIEVLPDQPRRAVEMRLRDYAQSVVEREWPAMAEGTGADPVTAERYENVWRELYVARATASGPGDAAFFNQAVQEMNTIGVQRRMRLLSSGSALPSIMWILLVGGGLVTIGFAYLIGAPHAWLQMSVTGALTALVVFSLLLVAGLQHPFSGDIRVQPVAYEGVLKSFADRLQSGQSRR
jgi:hypothetical protein